MFTASTAFNHKEHIYADITVFMIKLMGPSRTIKLLHEVLLTKMYVVIQYEL